jgi:hypothetical protein
MGALHFDEEGLTLESFPVSFWKCKKVALIGYSASRKTWVSPMLYKRTEWAPATSIAS